MTVDNGRVGKPTGLSQAEPSSTVSALTGFDPSREALIQRVILAISSASVPHEHWQPGALSSRSLGYYLGVGIDYYRHDYARHEILLRKAAEQAIAAIFHSSTKNGDDALIRRAAYFVGTDGAELECGEEIEVVAALERAAIATEARRAETENTGSVHEGAGLKGIAQ